MSAPSHRSQSSVLAWRRRSSQPPNFSCEPTTIVLSIFKPPPSSLSSSAFTLIELITVILIIAILAAALMSATTGMFDRARKVQAKNDITQLVTAINAYYTEYGKYPVADTLQGQADTLFGKPGGAHGNDEVMNVLRSINAAPNASYVLNPRQIMFMNIPNAKSATSPKEGIAAQAVTSPNGAAVAVGAFVDPWGNPYMLAIDCNYDGYTQDSSPYTDLNYSTVGGQSNLVQVGCFALSWGKDSQQGTKGNNKYTSSDDVLSWQ